MRNFFILYIICIVYSGKEVTAEDVKNCAEFSKIDFTKVKDTSGNFHEVIARGNQFVTLQGNKLRIFEDLKQIIRKSFSYSPKRLNLDLFNNILFSNEGDNGIYTYIPENDDLILQSFPQGIITTRGVAFDNNNTIYAVSAENYRSHVFNFKILTENLLYIPRLKDFNNVTHIVNGDGNTFYFAHGSQKTSWVVNAATEQTIMQTPSIKHLSYISQDYYLGIGYIFFLDHNCTLKAFHITENFTLQKHVKQNYIKVMQLESCDYEPGDKLVFRAEDVSGISFFHNNNNFYRISMRHSLSDDVPLSVCLLGKLNNVTINSGAVNSNYIMLATSNGLWASKW